MKEALKNLTNEQISFIYSECGITENDLFALDADALYDDVYDVMCNIEIEEIPVSDDEKESERCKMASDIVTELGNALAKEEGLFDESNDE